MYSKNVWYNSSSHNLSQVNISVYLSLHFYHTSILFMLSNCNSHLRDLIKFKQVQIFYTFKIQCIQNSNQVIF